MPKGVVQLVLFTLFINYCVKQLLPNHPWWCVFATVIIVLIGQAGQNRVRRWVESRS